MAKEDKFLQFPLSALAFADSFQRRINGIISWSYVTAGAKMLEKLDETILEEKADRFANAAGTPHDYDPENREHLAAMLGAHDVGIKVSHLDASLEGWRDLKRFIADFESRYPGRVLVRLKRNWVFQTRDSQMLSPREFGIVCAIYSVLGDKDFSRVTRDRIQRRMMGYKDKPTFENERWNREDHETPLTIAQVQYSLEKLDERGFFARVRANKRETFYSIRLNRDELATALFAYKTRRAEFHVNRLERNDSLQAKIKQKCQSLIKVKKKVKQPIEPPNSIVTVSSQAPSLPASQASSLSLHFNKNVPNKNSSNKNDPYKNPLNTALASQAQRVAWPSLDEVKRFYQQEHKLGRNVAHTNAVTLLKHLEESGCPDGWQELAKRPGLPGVTDE